MATERELRDHAEVSAATAKRPQQLRPVGLAGDGHLPVREHHPRRDHVVARQAELARKPADAATEGQAARPGVRYDAGGCGQRVCLAGLVDLAQQASAAGAHDPALGVDRHRAHRAEVDHEAFIARALAGDAVATAAHRHHEIVIASKGERRDHVIVRQAAHNAGRPPVEHAVPHTARLVVARIRGKQHRAVKAGPQAIECEIGGTRHGHAACKISYL